MLSKAVASDIVSKVSYFVKPILDTKMVLLIRARAKDPNLSED